MVDLNSRAVIKQAEVNAAIGDPPPTAEDIRLAIAKTPPPNAISKVYEDTKRTMEELGQVLNEELLLEAVFINLMQSKEDREEIERRLKEAAEEEAKVKAAIGEPTDEEKRIKEAEERDREIAKAREEAKKKAEDEQKAKENWDNTVELHKPFNVSLPTDKVQLQATLQEMDQVDLDSIQKDRSGRMQKNVMARLRGDKIVLPLRVFEDKELLGGLDAEDIEKLKKLTTNEAIVSELRKLVGESKLTPAQANAAFYSGKKEKGVGEIELEDNGKVIKLKIPDAPPLDDGPTMDKLMKVNWVLADKLHEEPDMQEAFCAAHASCQPLQKAGKYISQILEANENVHLSPKQMMKLYHTVEASIRSYRKEDTGLTEEEYVQQQAAIALSALQKADLKPEHGPALTHQ